jgi:integrase
VDAAVVRLTERGRLKPLKHGQTRPAGKPLTGSTVNRYIAQLASVYKYARRLRLLPRAHVPPTRGFERAPEHPDPEKYLTPEQNERLIAVARIADRRWRKLPALIELRATTGLRIGNALALRWSDVDRRGASRNSTPSRQRRHVSDYPLGFAF